MYVGEYFVFNLLLTISVNKYCELVVALTKFSAPKKNKVF